ncbi:MAG TPA: hypothetical protein VHG91_00545 [Longimicrobium sp.]|nr:hypothetical protein [Longimicrobium sp.]
MDQLQAAASTPITVLTLLGGGLVVLAKSLDSSDPRFLVPFAIFCVTALVFACASAYCLVRSLNGHEYERIPHASQLAVYEAELKRYHRRVGTPWLAEPASEAFLAEKYVLAADRNAVNNIDRGEYLHKASRRLVYALCFTALAAIPVSIHVKVTPEKPQQIRIVNPRSEPVSNRKNSAPAQPGPHAGTPPAGQNGAPQPPTPPANFIVRTGLKIPPTRDQVLRGALNRS